MRKSRRGRYKQNSLIEHYVAGTTARTAASLCGVNREKAAFYFLRMYQITALNLEVESEALVSCEIEVDENYFGGKGESRHGRGAAEEILVFGLLKRRGKVYKKIIPEASSETLIPIINRKVIPDSTV